MKEQNIEGKESWINWFLPAICGPCSLFQMWYTVKYDRVPTSEQPQGQTYSGGNDDAAL